jgi:tetratricopeptide (TPR) repeat protein
MEIQPKECENCGISLSEGDKFCPMCKTPVEISKGRLAYYKKISRTRPGVLLLIGALVGIVVLASAIYVPQYTENWNNKGNDALNTKHFEEAVKYYSNALKINPSSEDALNGLGDAYLNLISAQGNNYALPLSYYEKANKCNKTGNSTYALNKMGMIYLSIEDYDSAQKIFQKIIDQDQKSPLDLANAWYSKGVALKQLNDLKGAIDCFNKSIAISASEINSGPQRQKALIAMGETFSSENESNKAEQCYKEALDISVDCGNCKNACHNLIKNLQDAGRPEEAKKYDEKCFSSLA